MPETVFEVQAIFSCAEKREDAMSRLIAAGYDPSNFQLCWHEPDGDSSWPGPDTSPEISHADNAPTPGSICMLTIRVRDEARQTRLLRDVRAAGATRAFAIMHLQ